MSKITNIGDERELTGVRMKEEKDIREKKEMYGEKGCIMIFLLVEKRREEMKCC